MEYLGFNEYFREVFGEKIVKYALDGGFTCPNRDGTLGREGCIFCGEEGSGEFTGQGNIKEQIAFQRELLRPKWGDARWIGYFQNFTNTYAPVEVLKQRFEPVLQEEGCVGLAIATRGDCLSTEVLDYLEDLSERCFLWVELGLQSIHEKIIAYLGRGYDHAQFDKSFQALQTRRINTLAHVIFGLPGESREDMLQTVYYVVKNRFWGIKIHSLYIQKDTRLYEEYRKHPFPLMTQEEYIEMVATALEYLPPNMVIHRLTGDPPRRLLVAPDWTTDKLNTIAQIRRLLRERNSKQGKLWKE